MVTSAARSPHVPGVTGVPTVCARSAPDICGHKRQRCHGFASPPCRTCCTSSDGAFLPNAGGDRRGSWDTRADPVPCEDVPAPSLTCPPLSPLPVLPGTMGGCFSKPKPGDCAPTSGPHPAVPVGEVGQRWMLAGEC